MATRYEKDFLLFLRGSPLCVKPSTLRPQEEWMGPPPDNTRYTTNKTSTERNRNTDNPLHDQTNRRPGFDRQLSRNIANPEDIVLGPARTAFASALRSTSGKVQDSDKTLKDGDSRDKFSTFRNRNGDLEGGDRFRDGKSSNFRRRNDPDQDNEGWSMVKPRKSFGHEGAERFHGTRMGGGGDRFAKEDRKTRDREDKEPLRERSHRAFDAFSRDKDSEETEVRSRNGLSRGKSEPWFKTDTLSNEPQPSAPRERIDQKQNWRERKEETKDAGEERGSGRYERRWDRDRDQRVERDPEWMDEPAEPKATGHTAEDMAKFLAAMKHRDAPEQKAAPAAPVNDGDANDKPKLPSVPNVEHGPDKFLMAFGAMEIKSSVLGEPTELLASKSKASSKPSRFTSFFNAPTEETARRQTEPPTPAAGPPPIPPNGALFSQSDSNDRAGFEALLSKLRSSKPQTTSPPAMSGFQEPPLPAPIAQELPQKLAIATTDAFPPFLGERREDPRTRQPHVPHSIPEILAPRPMIPTQTTPSRPEQLLQELVGQRQHASSQGSSRMEQPTSRNSNNADFLIQLMQKVPEPQRTELNVMRINQAQRQAQQGMPAGLHQMTSADRGDATEFIRERLPLQQQQQHQQAQHQQAGRQMRGGLPLGFLEEQFLHQESEPRQQQPQQPQQQPQQPTQILQRPPPPPGLDQLGRGWAMQGGPGGVPLGQQQRPVMPPPGLPGGPGRNMPMPGGMFPPNFPPGAFGGPPDGLGGLPGPPGPPRSMQPPPGFYPGPHGPPPPPGFMGPPPGMFQGPPGPDIPHGFGLPFEGRGMPPPGTNAGYRRQ